MKTHSNHHVLALAMIVLTFSSTGWQSPAHAETAPPARQQTGPGQAEVPGLAVHTYQRLRHPAPKSSFRSGLTLKITPVALGDAGWEFKASLDSVGHVPDDDLQAATVLIVDGKELKPTKWTITSSRSHHREGILTFPAPASTAKIMEVRVQRPGEPTARIFQWKGAELI